jgi:hypothetical protein
VVSIVRTVFCAVCKAEVKTICAGAKLHLALAGNVPHVRVIVPAYPFVGVRVNVAVPVLPWVIVNDVGLAVTL